MYGLMHLLVTCLSLHVTQPIGRGGGRTLKMWSCISSWEKIMCHSTLYEFLHPLYSGFSDSICVELLLCFLELTIKGFHFIISFESMEMNQSWTKLLLGVVSLP